MFRVDWAAMRSQPVDEGKTTLPDWLGHWTELFVNNLEEYAVFALDLSGTILTWQSGVGRVLGFAREAFVGLPADIIFTDSDRRAGAPGRELNTALQKGEALDERWHVRADGSRFWGSGITLALRGEAGEPVGFAKIVRDRTELRLEGESLGLQMLRLEGDVAARTDQIRALATDLTVAEQRERGRISQLLHDELQQQLYALQMLTYGVLGKAAALSTDAGGLRGDLHGDLLGELREVYELAKTSLATTRTLVSELSPAALRQGEFDQALLWLGEHMRSRHGLKVTVTGTEHLPDLPEAFGVLLFQCVHELLFNVVKHAQTDHAALCVRPRPGGFELEVWDEGRGFEVETPDENAPRQEGFGLQSVRRRLEPFGGVLTVASVPGSGTHVTIEVRLG